MKCRNGERALELKPTTSGGLGVTARERIAAGDLPLVPPVAVRVSDQPGFRVDGIDRIGAIGECTVDASKLSCG